MRSPRNRTIELSEEDRARTVYSITDGLAAYSAGEANVLVCGEVLEALAELRDSSFDLLIADPPYNLGYDFGNGTDRRPEDQYRTWIDAWIAASVRVLSPSASVYICTGWQHSGHVQESIEGAGLRILNRITWKREKGRGAKANWKNNMEDIWYAVRDPKSYSFHLDAVKVRKPVIAPYKQDGIPKDWFIDEDGKPIRMTHPSNIWTDLTVPFWSMPENTPHPTQKPEALLERIIAASSSAGDAVLDLFSGSGSASVVAMRMNRRSFGVELNEEFVRYGLRRLENLK